MAFGKPKAPKEPKPPKAPKEKKPKKPKKEKPPKEKKGKKGKNVPEEAEGQEGEQPKKKKLPLPFLIISLVVIVAAAVILFLFVIKPRFFGEPDPEVSVSVEPEPPVLPSEIPIGDDVSIAGLQLGSDESEALAEKAKTITYRYTNLVDAGKAAQLQTQVSEAISGLFAGARLEGAVLSQSVADTEELEQLARSLNVSLGKAALISDMVGQDISLEPEALAPLSIHEIALISQSRHLAGSVTQNGTASDRAYIGQERAKEIALAHAGLTASQIREYEVNLDTDDGIVKYVIEFESGIYDYEYEIDAVTGAILSYDKELD